MDIENIISIVVILMLCIGAIKYPPFTLFMISLAVNQGDGFGIARFLSLIGYNLYFSLQSLPLLVACMTSYYKINKNKYCSHYNYNIWGMSSIVMLCLLWILLTLIIKQSNILSMPNSLIYTGIPALIIGLNYWNDKKAQKLFVGLLLFHQVISVLLIVFPHGQLSLLAAMNYEPGGIDLAGINQDFTFEVARFGEQDRVYAQHDNPNTYGLYSIISLAVGFYLLSKKSKICLVSSVILILTSIIGVSVTMSRASILGGLLGSTIVFLRNIKKMSRNAVVTLVTIIVSFAVFILINSSETILQLFETQDFDTRFNALKLGIEVITNNPILGANLEFAWPENIPPHQIMVYFAAMHGLFTGILVTLLYSLSILTLLNKRSGIELSILFGTICIFTGLANNFAAPILYWLCFSYSLIPVAISTRIHHRKVLSSKYCTTTT